VTYGVVTRPEMRSLALSYFFHRHAHVLRETTGDLRNRKLGGHDNGLNALHISTTVVQHDVELSGLLERGEGAPAVVLEPESGGLKNARDRGAHNVLAAFGKIHVTVGRDSGETIVPVPVKSDLEHGGLVARVA